MKYAARLHHHPLSLLSPIMKEDASDFNLKVIIEPSSTKHCPPTADPQASSQCWTPGLTAGIICRSATTLWPLTGELISIDHDPPLQAWAAFVVCQDTLSCWGTAMFGLVSYVYWHPHECQKPKTSQKVKSFHYNALFCQWSQCCGWPVYFHTVRKNVIATRGQIKCSE